jgi:hypothetical protein
MDLSPWALPAGLAVAGIGVAAAIGMLLGNRRRTAEQHVSAEERAELVAQRRLALQRRLAVIALAIGCVMMFVLAGIAAWLSFGAQREYAHAHNGGDWDAATGFALLLDAGALSLSLIRFFEALTLRSSAITRILLLAFVSASAAMNLLHAPEAGAGSAFLAMVPPLEYAALLEMLLYKVEQVIMGRQKRRRADGERGYSLLLWLPWPIGAPVKLWKAWRTDLLSTVDNVRVTGSRRPLPTAAEPNPATPPPAVPAEPTPPAAARAQLPAVATATAGQAAAPAVNSRPAGTQPAARKHTQPPVPAAPATAAQQTTAVDPGAAAGREKHEALAPATSADSSPAPAPGPAAEPALVQVGPNPEPEADPAAHESEAEPNSEAEEDNQLVEDTEDGADDDEPEPEDEDAEEPDTEHEHASSGTGDDEVREERRIHIDLSTLPKDEGPRQLAERIYVAHHVAGLPLDKADLARWAGYTNPRSGGNEYRRLEKEFGPILERKGAAYVDLDWSSLDQHKPSAVSPGQSAGEGQRVKQTQAA